MTTVILHHIFFICWMFQVWSLSFDKSRRKLLLVQFSGAIRLVTTMHTYMSCDPFHSVQTSGDGLLRSLQRDRSKNCMCNTMMSKLQLCNYHATNVHPRLPLIGQKPVLCLRSLSGLSDQHVPIDWKISFLYLCYDETDLTSRS